MNKRTLAGCIAGLVLAMTTATSIAQENFPQRPVRLVLGFGAGGSVDIAARALAEAAGRNLGQPVIVENVTGAGGGIALADLSRRPADGYTVGITTSSYAAITAQLQKPPLDLGTIETLLGVAEFRQVLFTKSDSPLAKWSDVVATRRAANPIRYSHLGTGTSLHIQGHLAFKAAGVETVNVGYRGAPDMITAVVGGHSDIGVADISAVDALLQAGKLRLLAAATRERLKEYPDVPTLLEQGVHGPEALNPGVAVVIRKGTPEDRVAKLREAFRKAAQSPEFANSVGTVKMQVRVMPAAEFDAIIQQASRVAAPVIEEIKRADPGPEKK